MEEVELLCDYIIILDKGKVIAKGSSDELKNMIDINEKISFESEKLSEEIINKIKELPNLIDFSYKSNTCNLTFSHGNENLINLIKLLGEFNLSYDNLFSKKPTLNDVFLELTGKDLRD